MTVDWLQHIPRWMFDADLYGPDGDWHPLERSVKSAFVSTVEEIPFALNAWITGSGDQIFIEPETDRLTLQGLKDYLGWDFEYGNPDGVEGFVSTPDLSKVDGPRLAANTHLRILIRDEKRGGPSPHLIDFGHCVGSFHRLPRRFPVPRNRMKVVYARGKPVVRVKQEDLVSLYGKPPHGPPHEPV